MPGKTCCLAWCRAQNDRDAGQSGAFFTLPGLKRWYSYRQQCVQAVGLPEVYMQQETNNARICWRHYLASEIETSGQRLRLKPGTLFFHIKRYLMPFLF